jgi:hypothetical protein
METLFQSSTLEDTSSCKSKCHSGPIHFLFVSTIMDKNMAVFCGLKLFSAAKLADSQTVSDL